MAPQRPSTQGCTEQSCMYHGEDNREKALHAALCPVRTDQRSLEMITTRCTCSRAEMKEARR